MDAVRIAHAFLVSAKTMGRRPTKIRDGGIPFGVPPLRELPQRLDDELEAIYAPFGIAWDGMAGLTSAVGTWPRGRSGWQVSFSS
jgi:RNA polymerase sigma-70 factor, ECF subfamily